MEVGHDIGSAIGDAAHSAGPFLDSAGGPSQAVQDRDSAASTPNLPSTTEATPVQSSPQPTCTVGYGVHGRGSCSWNYTASSSSPTERPFGGALIACQIRNEEEGQGKDRAGRIDGDTLPDDLLKNSPEQRVGRCGDERGEQVLVDMVLRHQGHSIMATAMAKVIAAAITNVQRLAISERTVISY